MKLKINQDIKYKSEVFKKDSVIEIDGDSNNTPLDSFWRRRLDDSRIDGCVEVVKETTDELNLDKRKKNNKKNK